VPGRPRPPSAHARPGRRPARPASRPGPPGARSWCGRVPEPVVVVGDRHDPWTATPADLAVPGTTQPLHSLADEDLDRVGTFGGFGQIPQAKVSLQLNGMKVGNRTGHGDSSFRRTGWGSSSRPGVHLSEAAGLPRRSASRRPTPGREARKSPCQQLNHEYQASVPGDHKANEIARGRGACPSPAPPTIHPNSGHDSYIRRISRAGCNKQ
jgi:hypothetical protein